MTPDYVLNMIIEWGGMIFVGSIFVVMIGGMIIPIVKEMWNEIKNS